jgi:hypothetical protein
MPEVHVSSEELVALGKRLRKTGAGELRKELLRGFRRELKPAIPLVRASAREHLPHAGGLAEQVAKSSFGVRTQLTGNSVGVRIRGTGKKGSRGLRAMNEGRLRKPLFGDRGHWYEQSIRAGWFSDPLEARHPQYLNSVQGVMRDVAKKIGKPL